MACEKKKKTLIANFVESVVSCSSGSLKAKYSNFWSQFAPISWNVASGGGKGKKMCKKKKQHKKQSSQKRCMWKRG